MTWYSEQLARWSEPNPPASPMTGRSCSTPLSEALRDIDDMRHRIWRACRRNIATCRTCGAKIIFLRRLDERKNRYVQTPVDIDPAIKGAAMPWHRIFRGRKHSRHRCQGP